MADKKISQLSAASTPLAGTEVLPIVQSNATVKVATDDLTVKNIRSNATNGILQVSGPGSGTTRIMTVPNADFTAARTDAANSFTGDQTFSTGNLIFGTAAKGVDFSANPNAPGMTSELFNDYENGTWTPTIAGITTAGANTYLRQHGVYRKIGQMVQAQAWVSLSAVDPAMAGSIFIGGLPFNTLNVGDRWGAATLGAWEIATNAIYIAGFYTHNDTRIRLKKTTAAATTPADVVAADIGNTSFFILSITYATD